MRFFRNLIIIILMLAVFAVPVLADTMIGSGNDTDKQITVITGGGTYDKDSYYIDIEPLKILDAAAALIHTLTNAIFSITRLLADTTITIFSKAIEFDIVEQFEGTINEIQKSLFSGIFKSLFTLAFAAVMFDIARRLLKGDLAGSIGEVVKTVLVLVLATFVTVNSSVALSGANEISKKAGETAMLALNVGFSAEDFSGNMQGLLWNNMIHKPWLSMEFFGMEGSEGTAETILGKSRSERESYIEEKAKENKGSNGSAEKVV